MDNKPGLGSQVEVVVVRSDKAAVVMYRVVVAGAMDGRLDRRILGQHRAAPVERKQLSAGERGEHPAVLQAVQVVRTDNSQRTMEPGWEFRRV